MMIGHGLRSRHPIDLVIRLMKIVFIIGAMLTPFSISSANASPELGISIGPNISTFYNIPASFDPVVKPGVLSGFFIKMGNDIATFEPMVLFNMKWIGVMTRMVRQKCFT
jgi:hypothetical protein